jgi:hypothetical protein
VGGGYNDRSIVCSSLTCSKFLHKHMLCCVWACMPLCTCAALTFLRSMLLAPLHPLTSSIHLTHTQTYSRIYTHVSPYLVSPCSNYALPLFLLPLLVIAHAPCNATQYLRLPLLFHSISSTTPLHSLVLFLFLFFHFRLSLSRFPLLGLQGFWGHHRVCYQTASSINQYI